MIGKSKNRINQYEQLEGIVDEDEIYDRIGSHEEENSILSSLDYIIIILHSILDLQSSEIHKLIIE